MVVVRISQVNSSNEDQSTVENFWKAAVSTGDKNKAVDVVNPFSNEQEKDVHWYMEDYVNNPYDVSKAAKVSTAIKEYAAQLASTVASTGLIPRKGEWRPGTGNRVGGNKKERRRIHSRRSIWAIYVGAALGDARGPFDMAKRVH